MERPSRLSSKYKRWNSFDDPKEVAVDKPVQYGSYYEAPTIATPSEESDDDGSSVLTNDNLPDPSIILNPAAFSDLSRDAYRKFLLLNRNVYVSRNGIHEMRKGLFANRRIEKGEVIVPYLGERITWKGHIIRSTRGHNMDYMADAGRGVYIDSSKSIKGGALANHRCHFNARLEQGRLPGPDRAPVVYLRAKEMIKCGRSICCDYRWTYRKNIRVAKVIEICACISIHC